MTDQKADQLIEAINNVSYALNESNRLKQMEHETVKALTNAGRKKTQAGYRAVLHMLGNYLDKKATQ